MVISIADACCASKSQSLRRGLAEARSNFVGNRT
jgi:hypothetical protein